MVRAPLLPRFRMEGKSGERERRRREERDGGSVTERRFSVRGRKSS